MILLSQQYSKSRSTNRLGDGSKYQSANATSHEVHVKPRPRARSLSNISNGDDIKSNKSIVYKEPVIEEMKLYFKENGFSEELAMRVHKAYSESNWHDTKGNNTS